MRKTFNRVTDARAFKTQVEHEINHGLYLDRSRGKTPFEEVAADWIESKVNLRLSTWNRDQSYLPNHVTLAFGPMAVAAITKADVQAWVRDLQAKDLAPRPSGTATGSSIPLWKTRWTIS